jgi:hypothetical protein
MLNQGQIDFLIEESARMREEGYMTESVDANNISVLLECYIEKLYGIAYTVWQEYDNNPINMEKVGFQYNPVKDRFAYEIVESIMAVTHVDDAG